MELQSQNGYEEVEESKVITVTTANTDLNDYKEDGLYYFGVNYTPTSIPAGVNGWLKVMAEDTKNYVKQIWFRHGTADVNDFETYIRTYSNKWSEWKKFAIEEDSGWIDLTLNNGITVGSIVKKAQYRKVGKIVYVQGDVAGVTAANTLVAILPSGFRPSAQMYFINALSSVRYSRIYVATNGNIVLEWTSDGNYNSSWYSINCSFVID